MIEYFVIAALAAALVVQNYLSGRAQRRLLETFSEQTKSMIAQADERVKAACSQEEKAYMAFHAAASPQTFGAFRNWSGPGVLGAQYPTKQHYKKREKREQEPAQHVVKELPFPSRQARDPEQNIPVAMGLDIDQFSTNGRAD